MLAEEHQFANFLANLNQKHSEQAVFSEVARSLGEFVSADRISVALLLPEGKTVEVIALRGAGLHLPLGGQVPLKNSAVGRALDLRRTVRWELNSEPFVEAEVLSKLGLLHFMIVPLFLKETPWGTLNLARAGHAFDDTELQLLEKVASIVTATVSRMRMLSLAQDDLHRQRDYTRKLEMLSRVSAHLSGTIKKEQAFAITAEAMRELFQIERVSFTNKMDDDHFLVRWVSGNSIIAQGACLPIKGTSQEAPLLEGGVIHFPDLTASPHPEHQQLAGAGMIAGSCYPLSSRGEVTGVLNVCSSNRELCKPENESLILTLASVLSSAIQRLDAQEQRAREQRVQQAQFQAISKAVALGLFVTDAEGVRTYANPAVELLGAGSDWLERVAPEDRVRLDSLWRNFVQDPQPQLETEYQTTDQRCLRLVASPIQDGEITLGFVGTLADVTERKRHDTALWHAQKLESLGVLAGGLAHDFNNILAAAMGNLELIQESLGAGGQVEHELEQLGTALRRGAQLTRQMLAYTGKARRQVSSVNLVSLINEMVTLLGATLPKNVQLKRELPNRCAEISADSTQIQQVLMNLLTNAAEAMPSTGGSISLGVRTTVVEQESAEWQVGPGRYIEVSFADNGCGMSADVLERIFDPFFTTKEGGSGLGLSAAMGIIRSHNGDLRVSSTPGAGTTFRILFPESSSAPVDQRPGGPLAYLADDEAQVRIVIGKMLRRMGFSVVEAADGIELLEGIKREEEPISLVFTDISMPGLDGIQVARELARLRPGLPCVLMSGYVEKGAEAQLEQLGPFLEKPFSLKDLKQTIRDVTGGLP